MKTKILVQVEGGLVQAVFVNNQEVEVIIQDFDVEASDDDVIVWNDGTPFRAYSDNGIYNPELIDNVKELVDNQE